MTRPEWMKDCTEECGRPVYCTVCGKSKAPRGRDVGLYMWNSYCHPTECDGYDQPPKAPHLWPNELRDADEEEKP